MMMMMMMMMKCALVAPLPKVRPPKNVENNLKPISLTLSLAKVLEGSLQSLCSLAYLTN